MQLNQFIEKNQVLQLLQSMEKNPLLQSRSLRLIKVSTNQNFVKKKLVAKSNAIRYAYM